MSSLTRINKILGWILFIGLVLTQTVISVVCYNAGGMAPFLALFSGIIILPFVIVAFSSTLNRDKHIGKIKAGLSLGVICQAILPIFLPLLFDQELIYLSIVGIILGTALLMLRKNVEHQLLVLNLVPLAGLFVYAVVALIYW